MAWRKSGTTALTAADSKWADLSDPVAQRFNLAERERAAQASAIVHLAPTISEDINTATSSALQPFDTTIDIQAGLPAGTRLDIEYLATVNDNNPSNTIYFQLFLDNTSYFQSPTFDPTENDFVWGQFTFVRLGEGSIQQARRYSMFQNGVAQVLGIGNASVVGEGTPIDWTNGFNINVKSGWSATHADNVTQLLLLSATVYVPTDSTVSGVIR